MDMRNEGLFSIGKKPEETEFLTGNAEDHEIDFNNRMQDQLSKLINYLTGKMDEQGYWQITRDEILDILDLDITDVYSLIVSSSDPMVNFQTSQYANVDVGALISLLECLGFKKAPDSFWNAGFWIPYSVQIELQSLLIDEITEERNQHQIEFDSFLAIFDRFGIFHRSIDIYLEEYFPRETISNNVIQKLLDSLNVDPGENRVRLLRSLAFELFRREIIPYRNLFSRFFPELKNYLISKGRIEPPVKPAPPMNEAELKARQLFSYSPDQSITLKELKDRYKNLMKRYHPDINPEGLEMSKEINRAYSLLLPES